ncbi:MAG: hypothetical protein PHT40_03740 [Patescibacteria group bacterium]|nr:hypothetical protein [Patescibacteria group bacterium]
MEFPQPNLTPENELSSGVEKEIIAPKIADMKHRLAAPKKGIKFYWHQVRLIALTLAVLEFLVYVFSTIPAMANFANEIFSPVSVLAQITAFIFLSAKFLKEKSVKRSFLAPLFCAFLAGLILAIVQLILYHRVWTLYNLALEPIWWLVRALVVVILVNIVYKIYQLLTFKKGVEPTLKIN